MGESRRQGVFLILSGALAFASLAMGIWLYRVSGARHLILAGAVTLVLTVATALWWRRSDSD